MFCKSDKATNSGKTFDLACSWEKKSISWKKSIFFGELPNNILQYTNLEPYLNISQLKLYYSRLIEHQFLGSTWFFSCLLRFARIVRFYVTVMCVCVLSFGIVGRRYFEMSILIFTETRVTVFAFCIMYSNICSFNNDYNVRNHWFLVHYMRRECKTLKWDQPVTWLKLWQVISHARWVRKRFSLPLHPV